MGHTPKASAAGTGKRWLMRVWVALTTPSAVRPTTHRSVTGLALVAVGAAVTLFAGYAVLGGEAAGLRGYSLSAFALASTSTPVGSPSAFLEGPRAVTHPHGVAAAPTDGKEGDPHPRLVQLMVGPQRKADILSSIASGGMGGSWTLTQRQTCDTELLLNGGFSPLVGFMDGPTYTRVLSDMRLGEGFGLGGGGGSSSQTVPSRDGGEDAAERFGAYYAPGISTEYLPTAGLLWPMPITLDLPREALVGLTTVDGRTLASVESGSLHSSTSPRGGAASPPSTLVPGPSGLPVPASSRLLLRDAYHNAIAVLTITDLYLPDVCAEASTAFGTDDDTHPGVAHLLKSTHPVYVGGILEGLSLPQHYDFVGMRRTPSEVRAELARRGWARTVAFQTRNPMHRAHIELTRLAGLQAGAGVLLHPVVGMTKPGDVEYAVRVRCYEAVAGSGRYYPPGGVLLSLLPLAMRMGGPREALWHAIIRKNHGATHFIVGRDHAGVKSGRSGKDFYGAYDAQALVLAHAAELGMSVIPFQEVEYVPSLGVYLPSDRVPAGEKTLSISGTKFRALMARGDDIPSWFSDPDVISILRALQPPTRDRGFVVFFSGLSGGGKTTLSHALIQRLQALVPTRKITILDGDVVRTHLSKGLGFSITDRNTNIERIGFVAAEAARHGGIVIAAPIAPFESSRASVRKMVLDAAAGFIMVHVATSVGECAARDVKGLYGASGYGMVEAVPAPDASGWRVAVEGVSNDLTGISHPYEHPDVLPTEALYPSLLAAASGSRGKAGKDGPADPGSLSGVDVWLDTEEASVSDGASAIIARLVHLGFIDDGDVSGAGAGVARQGGSGPPGAEKDDNGTGRRRTRLTGTESAMAAALRGAGGSGGASAASPCFGDGVCSPWAESLTSSLHALVRVFPTGVAESVGKAQAAALLLSGHAAEPAASGVGRSGAFALHAPTCALDWDQLLVSATTSTGAVQLKDVDLRAGTGGNARAVGGSEPTAHGSGPVWAVEPATQRTLLRMHAGLPSLGSPSAAELHALSTSDGTSGRVLNVGQQPAHLVLALLLLHGPNRGMEAIGGAVLKAMEGQGPRTAGVLPRARVQASVDWAMAVEGGKKSGGGLQAAGHTPDPAPLLLPLSSWQDAESEASQTGKRPALTDSARVAAAHDLWTGLRWSALALSDPTGASGEWAQDPPTSTTTHEPVPTVAVLIPADAAEAVLDLVPTLLRLDPCLRVLVVDRGEGGAGGSPPDAPPPHERTQYVSMSALMAA